MGKGTNSLARVIAERITVQAQRPDALELGTIETDMSLKCDRFAVPIPRGGYLIAEWTAQATLPAFSLVGRGESPVNDDGSPAPPTSWTQQTRWDWRTRVINNVEVKVKPELAPGDRVLVAWVNDGADPVVISKVVTG